MELVAGTALLTFGGALCGGRVRLTVGHLRWLRPLVLTAVALGLPGHLAAGALSAGWLLCLTGRWRSIGWDLFAIGCAALGRDLVAIGPPRLPVAAASAFWLLGWASRARLPRGPASVGRRLRLELLRARRAVAPQTPGDAWRVRAADALERALSLARWATARPLRREGERGALLRWIVGALAEGAAQLADGDPRAARARFAEAWCAARSAAGHCFRGDQEGARWLELIAWCEFAAALVDEEARQ